MCKIFQHLKKFSLLGNYPKDNSNEYMSKRKAAAHKKTEEEENVSSLEDEQSEFYPSKTSKKLVCPNLLFLKF